MSHRHDHEHPHGHDHDHHDHDHGHDHSEAPAAVGSPQPAAPNSYWRSLRELAGREPSRAEFPPGADQPPPRDPMSRRNFFHLMGASAGLAGLAAASGCRRYESEEIVPLARRPENQVPGTTLQYSTAYDFAGSAQALVATSFEGRPVHLDGNPEHPFAGGPIVSGTKRHAGVHYFATGSLLHLYDPDRSQNPTNSGKGASLDQLKAALAEVRKTIGAGTHVLSEASSSPTVQRMRRALEAKGAFWHEYEPLSWDNERMGTKRAFGKPVRPLAKLDKCETIVTIDCDIFVEHPAAMRYSRDFARSRRKDGTLLSGKMNRLWTVESTFTNTGAMADHRLPMRSELGLTFALALDAALGGGSVPQSEFLKEEKPSTFLKFLTQELRANSGRAVVLAGRRQPPEVHALVAKINQAIGAVGATLDYVEDPDPDRPSHHDAIRALATAIDKNAVQTLIILGGNPVYDAPADLDFAGKLAKVQTSIRLGEYEDETSKKTTWHVPRAHFLEAWGDARTWDGTISIAQPLIAPLYGGLSSAELISLLLGDEKSSEDLVKDTHRELGGGMWPWRQNVHDGFVPGTQLPVAQVQLVGVATPGQSDSQKAGSVRKNGELEVTFHFSSATYDGRFANNAWLWETPDFLTKVTWDNYALVSPETAKLLELENDTLITVKIGERSIELPCYTMPGQARYSIALVLGGGRTEAGHVVTHPHNVDSSVPGKRVVGWDTYKVRTTNNASGYGFDIALGATVTGGGRKYELANVQDHWDYKPGPTKIFGYDKAGFDPEVERRSHEDVKEITNKEFEDPTKRSWKAGEESEFWDDAAVRGAEDRKPRGLSLFEEHTYNGHRWAMAIDLSTCTGCNACMVACQSENNVPVVGRREVINNREMHWIRIDRYFQGSPEDPRVVHQPLACQQCENAPCEQVCPVGATSHSDEGLNDMAYNRCIGTRYCLNNCPYKVRRFNFLDWNSEFREARAKVRRLLFNPDVTVRMRGVMEKCTFCVQRIQNAKIKWKAQHRMPVPGTQVEGNLADPMPDGTIETACQMACPTEAIVFGDLMDAESRVSKLHADRRSYDLLPDNYTKPRNKYIARILNPHPDWPKAASAEGER